MKKAVIMLVLFIAGCGFLFAQDIDLSMFPEGKWLDPNYNAVWVSNGSTLKIVSPDGMVYYDFAGKTITDFAVGTRDGNPSVSFYCKETEKKYYLTKPAMGTDIILEIDHPTKGHYKVVMKTQD